MAEEILVRAPKGHRDARITIPAMGTCPSKAYVADDDGVFHFQLEERTHADHANELFRNEDKAIATLEERAALMASRAPGAGDAAAAARDANLAVTMATLMPAMMRQMRDEMREMREEIREELLKEMSAKPSKGSAPKASEAAPKVD